MANLLLHLRYQSPKPVPSSSIWSVDPITVSTLATLARLAWLSLVFFLRTLRQRKSLEYARRSNKKENKKQNEKKQNKTKQKNRNIACLRRKVRSWETDILHMLNPFQIKFGVSGLRVSNCR